MLPLTLDRGATVHAWLATFCAFATFWIARALFRARRHPHRRHGAGRGLSWRSSSSRWHRARAGTTLVYGFWQSVRRRRPAARSVHQPEPRRHLEPAGAVPLSSAASSGGAPLLAVARLELAQPARARAQRPEPDPGARRDAARRQRRGRRVALDHACAGVRRRLCCSGRAAEDRRRPIVAVDRRDRAGGGFARDRLRRPRSPAVALDETRQLGLAQRIAIWRDTLGDDSRLSPHRHRRRQFLERDAAVSDDRSDLLLERGTQPLPAGRCRRRAAAGDSGASRARRADRRPASGAADSRDDPIHWMRLGASAALLARRRPVASGKPA